MTTKLAPAASLASAADAPHTSPARRLVRTNPLIPANLAATPLSGITCGNHPSATQTFQTTSLQDTGGRGMGTQTNSAVRYAAGAAGGAGAASIRCSSLPGLNRTALPGAMLTSVPVLGFRAVQSGRRQSASFSCCRRWCPPHPPPSSAEVRSAQRPSG